MLIRKIALRNLLTLVFLVQGLGAFAQFPDHIVIDTAYMQGKVTPLSDTRINFIKSGTREVVTYSANDISEYGYDGKVYVSLLTGDLKRFYEQTLSGKIKLLQHGNNLVIRHDSTFSPLNSENYRATIAGIIDCPGEERGLMNLKYSKASIKGLLRSYNKGKCIVNNLPRPKTGVYAGYNFLTFQATDDNATRDLSDNSNFVQVGIFHDFPLHVPRNLYISTELHWLYSEPLFYEAVSTDTYYYGIKVNGISAPIGLKLFLVARGPVQAYVKAGGLFSYIQLSSPTGITETITQNNNIYITRKEIEASSNFMSGFNAALGAEIPYRDGRNFHFEVKYVDSTGGQFKRKNEELSETSLSFSGLWFMVGFNL